MALVVEREPIGFGLPVDSIRLLLGESSFLKKQAPHKIVLRQFNLKAALRLLSISSRMTCCVPGISKTRLRGFVPEGLSKPGCLSAMSNRGESRPANEQII
jgi:hypothetical protein